MDYAGAPLRQVFSGPRFWLAVAGMAAVIAAAGFDDLLSAFRSPGLLAAGFHTSFLIKALNTDLVRMALTLAAVVPCASLPMEELRCGFLKEYLPRSGYRPYVAGKLLAGICSGGGAAVAGAWTLYGLAALVFLPMEATPEPGAASGTLAELFRLSGTLFLCGALWAVTAAAAAVQSGSKYMAYGACFVIYYLLIILTQRYFPGLDPLNPSLWLSPAEDWPFQWGGLFLWLGELLAAASLWFVLAMERRLKQL